MKIGIIGAQNSHTDHFCKALNGEKICGDARVAYLYGPDAPEHAEELSEMYGVTLCASEEELIEKADAVAITYRKGSMHYQPAMKVLKAGKPLFNDKPFAIGKKQCAKITEYARKNGLLLAGGSNLKGLKELEELKKSVISGSTVTISFAADVNSEYDGYWFYGIHSAELCIALCGENYTSVSSFQNGDAIVSVISYRDRQCIICNTPHSYDLRISVTNGEETVNKKLALLYQNVGPMELVKMVETGVIPRDFSHYERAVELVETIMNSYQKNT